MHTYPSRAMRATARLLFLLPAFPILTVSAGAQPTQKDLERATRILRQTPLIDGHNDLPWAIREDTLARGNVAAYDLRQRTRGHTDLERLRAGLVGGQFWSVYVPGEYRGSGFARVQLERSEERRVGEGE